MFLGLPDLNPDPLVRGTDPDPHPDPYQNVTDPLYCWPVIYFFLYRLLQYAQSHMIH
jgi:hypothetical protein